MMEPVARKMLADEYDEKWGEEHYPSNSGTSNEGDKETQEKEKEEHAHNESDSADETESDTENKDEAYILDDDEGADEKTDFPWK
jgi:hypothetical protein